jgi:hypothetical protein
MVEPSPCGSHDERPRAPRPRSAFRAAQPFAEPRVAPRRVRCRRRPRHDRRLPDDKVASRARVIAWPPAPSGIQYSFTAAARDVSVSVKTRRRRDRVTGSCRGLSPATHLMRAAPVAAEHRGWGPRQAFSSAGSGRRSCDSRPLASASAVCRMRADLRARASRTPRRMRRVAPRSRNAAAGPKHPAASRSQDGQHLAARTLGSTARGDPAPSRKFLVSQNVRARPIAVSIPRQRRDSGGLTGVCGATLARGGRHGALPHSCTR